MKKAIEWCKRGDVPRRLANAVSSYSRTLAMLATHRARTEGSDYIFVLSHMRSMSTLLCHILGSHPEIAGYTESGLSYRHQMDLYRLQRSIVDAGHGVEGVRYFLDKNLHNDITVREDILARESTRVIFMLRGPVSTIRSIMNMRARLHGNGDEEFAAAYYVSRLAELRRIASLQLIAPVFVESERLRESTDEVLGFLSRSLKLTGVLSANYGLFQDTGKPGKGDPSANIQAGRILSASERPVGPYDEYEAPPARRREMEDAYTHTKLLLVERCKSLG